jgi:Flp pilus assembly protein TadD
MFVVLALLMGVGFVAFGVGSDVQGGIADVIGIGGTSGDDIVSVDEARETLKDKPNDPTALRDLATALQREGQTEEAIAPLETYTALRAKDEEALTELAGLYLAKASRIGSELQLAQARAQFLDPGADFLPPATSQLGQALATPPITRAITEDVNARINTLYGEVQSTYGEAKDIYTQLATLAPKDPDIQIQLGDAALNAGDAAAAIAAYQKFVKLAPDDPRTPLIKQQIKQIQAASAVTPQG